MRFATVLAAAAAWTKALAPATLAGIAAAAALVITACALGIGHAGLLAALALSPMAAALTFAIPHARSRLREPRTDRGSGEPL